MPVFLFYRSRGIASRKHDLSVLPFASAGMFGAFIGSIFGKVIAALILNSRSKTGLPDVWISWANMPDLYADA